MLLLLVLIVSLKCSYCGPEIFKFTYQPVSQTVSAGGSVTLSCVATGRSGITYSWYRLDMGFSTPPSDTDLINGEVNTNYVVQAADVDDSGEERLFLCKATAGSDVILSNVATVLYKLSDSIEFDNSGSIYNAVKSIPNDLNDPGVYLYRLHCNFNVVKFDDVIINGEPYDVQWFKTGESGRVEDNHDNMWTNYHKTDLNSYKVDVAGSESSVSPVKQYDLFIFNVRTSDAGTYSCKAVSRVNKQEVLLGSTVLTVGTENTGLAIYPKEIITGYMVLAVDNAGKITSAPKVGDKVFLMCGVACRTSSGSLDPQYQWKDSSGNVITNTREHIVTLSSTGSVTFTCVISNSECTSKLSSAEKSVPPMTVLDADLDPLLPFTFSKSPPEYMWYDTSDDSNSHDPFEIGCQGSYSSGNSNVGFVNSVLRGPDTVASSGKDVVYDFSSSFSSDKSGVYQCVMFNIPENVVLYQQTTNVVIAAPASAAINPTILSVSSESTATFICTVGGYPVESVTISGPNNVNLDCLTTQTSGDVSCSSSDQSNYVVKVQNFKLEYSGDYICTVNTKWYKADNIAAIEDSAQDNVALSFVGNAEATLTRTPAGSELAKDASVTFTCSIIGSPRPTKLTLKKGDVVLKSYDAAGSADSDIVTTTYGISYTHDITTLALDDTALYTCEGENDNGGVKKDEDTTNLTVVSDVVVTLSSSTKTPTFGDTFTITCTATGGRKPHSVELQHDGNTITATDFTCTSEGDYTEKCLHSSTADYTSGGTYSCIGKNRVAGNVEKEDTETVTISVSKSVSVSLTPASGTPVEVTFGTTYTITCNVNGGDKPHKVTLNIPDSTNDLTWERDGQGNTLTCSGEFELSCEHQISKIAYSQEGEYTCIGYNKLPGTSTDLTDSKTASLVVVKDVTVSLSVNPATAEINHGTEFKITCVADGGRIPYFLEFSHTSISSSVSKLVTYDNTTSSTPATVTDDKTANTLTYVYTVAGADYEDNGSYSCISKNRASSNAERNNKKTAAVLVVKNVTSMITAPDYVNKGSQLKITCTAEGYRTPHEVTLVKDLTTLKSWNDLTTECTKLEFYKYDCVYIIASSEYSSGGNYKCISKNKALGNTEVSSEDSTSVLISQTVLTELSPSSTKELEWDSPTLTLTCSIEGGLQPHKATIEVPDGTVLTWSRDNIGDTANTLECTGDNEMSCLHEVLSGTFDSTGNYTCTGFNKLPDDSATVRNSAQTTEIVVVKDVQASLTSNPQSEEVAIGNEVNLTCSVVGGRTPFYLSLNFTNHIHTNQSIILYDESVRPDGVIKNKNSLKYVHVMNKVDYANNGLYECTGKNKALAEVEKTNRDLKKIVVVKNVEIETIPNIEADFGTSFTFNFKLNGGRSPHSVKLENSKSQIFDWSRNSNECTGTNELSCSKTVGDSDVNFGYDGDYTVTAKNRALNDAVVTASKTFTVTVYKDVSATITPSSDSTLTYHVDTNITCNVIGGLPPHKVDLILPNLVTKTWTKDGSGNSLTCTGTHDKTCTHTFTPEYNSDGDYKCVGYNKVRSDEEKQKESTVVQLTTVRSTEVSISDDTVSVLTNGTVDVHCTIVGKPLVDMSAVSWRHNKLTDLDWSSNVTTIKGSEDDYTLVSTLTLVNPSTNFSGSFNCNVQAENNKVISKSVVVSINNREYLDAPVVSHNRGEATAQDVEMSVTCRVEGFPRPSATLVIENPMNREESRTISGASRIISSTSTEYEFKLSTSCETSQYKFICETQTTKLTDRKVLKKSNSVEGPIVTGCKNANKMNTEALIAAGVAAVLFVVIIVFGIYILHLRRRQSHNTTTGNVVYVNTTPENMGDTKQSTEHKYDDVILQVSPGEAAYINTAVQSPSLHVYNDVVLPTADDTPYDYARSEDVVRNNVRAPIYNNHELK